MGTRAAAGRDAAYLATARARVFELEKGLHEFELRAGDDSEDDSTRTCHWCGDIPKEHGGFGPGWAGSMRCPYPELDDRADNEELQGLYKVISTAEGGML